MLSKDTIERIENKIMTLPSARIVSADDKTRLELLWKTMDDKRWGEAAELAASLPSLKEYTGYAVYRLFRTGPSTNDVSPVKTSVQVKNWCELVGVLAEKGVDLNESFAEYKNFPDWSTYKALALNMPWQCWWALIKNGADPLMTLDKNKKKVLSVDGLDKSLTVVHMWGAILNRVYTNGQTAKLSDDDSTAYVRAMSEIPGSEKLFWQKAEFGQKEIYPLVAPLVLGMRVDDIQTWFSLLQKGGLYSHGQAVPAGCPSVVEEALRAGNAAIMLAELDAGAQVTPFMQSCMEGRERLRGGHNWEEENRRAAVNILVERHLRHLGNPSPSATKAKL